MYGTVARMRVKPGMKDALRDYVTAHDSRTVPGSVASYVYQMDKDANELILVVIFDSKASYQANADSPDQDAEYQQMLGFLEGPPEWNDGEIIYSPVAKSLSE